MLRSVALRCFPPNNPPSGSVTPPYSPPMRRVEIDFSAGAPPPHPRFGT